MADESSEQGTIRYTRCPSCGTPNPATASTCSRCGKPMQATEAAAPVRPAPPATGQLVCPKCRKVLPPGSRFCGFCGAALTAPAPPAPKAPDRQSAPTQPVPVVGPPKAPPPVAKPPAPPTTTTPPPRPVVAKPPTPVPVAKPPQPPSPPTPAAPPAPALGEGTQVFTGLHVPKMEATLQELKQDGSTGKALRIVKETFIGRANCDMSYPQDALLSPRHASLGIRTGKLVLKDLGSQNGTFLKQRQDTELVPGDVFLIGRELFRFTTQSLDESPAAAEGTQVLRGAPKLQRGPVTAKLEHIQLTGEVIDTFPLDKSETTLGRTQGDLLFKNDPYMSGKHARIVAQPGRCILQDLKSRNGVYRRIRNEVELQDGDEFFLGEQIFRVDVKIS